MDLFDEYVELTIDSYHENGDYHGCRTKSNKVFYIDLMTDGSIKIPKGENYTEFCKSLVGRRVSIDYSHCFLHMAANPKIF